MRETEDWERYSRQMLFAPLGEAGQRRLAAATVAIVGCGALGSAQAESLTRAGVGRIHLIDRDYVEASNLQRQSLYDEADAAEGLPKAVAAARRLGKINSAVEIRSSVADLTPANVRELLAGADVALDGTDNFETRYLINDYAVEAGVPWIYGAAVGSTGVTFTVIPGETACLECVFGEMPGATTETCDTVGVLGWVVQLIAAAQAGEAVKLLAGARDRLRRTVFSADVWTNAFRELAAPARDPECPVCGRRDFVHLRGEGRAALTLCGRNSVQIHERERALSLGELGEKLRPHGEVRSNDFALRFVPRTAPGGAAIEMTVFPDGRALIKGTVDAGVARSLYARYVGA